MRKRKSYGRFSRRVGRVRRRSRRLARRTRRNRYVSLSRGGIRI